MYRYAKGVAEIMKQIFDLTATPDLETPDYTVLRRFASYEVREYEPFLVVGLCTSWIQLCRIARKRLLSTLEPIKWGKTGFKPLVFQNATCIATSWRRREPRRLRRAGATRGARSVGLVPS